MVSSLSSDADSVEKFTVADSIAKSFEAEKEFKHGKWPQLKLIYNNTIKNWSNEKKPDKDTTTAPFNNDTAVRAY